MDESYTGGVIRIGNETDRLTVAAILYKNGYTVRPVKYKKASGRAENMLSYRLEREGSVIGDES